MKNIESCKLAMMDSPSPPSLKETDGSTNEPIETLKKVDSSSEVDSTTKNPEENGHSEVKEKESEDDVTVTNGNKGLENGKDSSEASSNFEENGLETPKSPEGPEPEKSLDSEISALVETIDTDMKDDSECNDSSSEDSEQQSKPNEKSTDEVIETMPETEITSSTKELEDKKESEEKMESSESDKEPQNKSEICLEPVSSGINSSQSDSEDSEEEKSKDEESKTVDKPDVESITEEAKKEEPVKPEKDFKAALDELTSIAQTAKKINDDDLLGIKKVEGEFLYCLKQ